MAATITHNTIAVCFESVLAMTDKRMHSMFKMLENSGLRRFLGCSEQYSEKILKEFFESAYMENGIIFCRIQDKQISITQKMFADLFQLPTAGLTEFTTLPNGNDAIWREAFSLTDTPITSPCQKRDLKIEFRLMADIVAKGILAKAGAFDKVTMKKFLIMATIASNLTINWSDILFNILTSMVKKGNQSQGFAVPICHLLIAQGIQPVDMMEVGKTKLFNWTAVENFEKKNLPTDEELVSVKTETGVEFVKKKKASPSKTPKVSKRKLDLKSSSHDESRENILVSQVFKKKPSDKPKK